MPSRVDEMLSKGMGAVKGVKARFEGLTGVFKTLAEQHGQVTALLLRVKSSADKRAELWPKIRIELLSHEKGELREVFPALRDDAQTRPMAEQHDREAGELESQIQRIDALGFDSPNWEPEFNRLVELVKQHVDEEESSIFPKAQEVLGKDRAREMEPRFMAAKRAVMEQA